MCWPGDLPTRVPPPDEGPGELAQQAARHAPLGQPEGGIPRRVRRLVGAEEAVPEIRDISHPTELESFSVLDVDPGSPTRLAALLALAVASLGVGPCGPIAGGSLSGNHVDRAVDDWSFVNQVGTCAVEVRPDSPHSVTVNCMAWRGELFVSCSECDGKRWSGYALEDPAGRIRIGDEVYAVTLRRVEEPERLDAVWRARAAKLGEDESTPRPEHWWSFQLSSL